MQVHEALVTRDESDGLPPGSVLPLRKRLVVACGQGSLELMTIEPAGRRAMTGSAYLNGLRAPIDRIGQGMDHGGREPLVRSLADDGAEGAKHAFCG